LMTSKHKGKVGPELIKSILNEAEDPLTTKQLQEEVHKVESRCLFSSAVALNLMRISGTIKGKRKEDRKWIWWIDKE